MPQATGRLKISSGAITYNGNNHDGETISFTGTFHPSVPRDSDVDAHGAHFTYEDKKDIPGPHSFSGHVGREDVNLQLSRGCAIKVTTSIATRTNIDGNGTASAARS
jgi:hypothetical protein